MHNQLLLTFNDTEKMNVFLAFIEHLDYIEKIEKIEVKKIENEDLTITEQNFEIELIEPIDAPKNNDYSVQEITNFASQFPTNYLWKAQDIDTYFPKDLKISVQIIQNQLFIMASPNFTHQVISEELGFQMGSFIRTHQLGKLLYAPIDTILDEDNLVQPDILFIAVKRYTIIENGKIKGSPDIVVEIWSPANKKKERDAKHDLYEKNQITEYWQIFPKKQKVIIETMNENGEYEIFSKATKKGTLYSKVLEGFRIETESLFENVEG